MILLMCVSIILNLKNNAFKSILYFTVIYPRHIFPLLWNQSSLQMILIPFKKNRVRNCHSNAFETASNVLLINSYQFWLTAWKEGLTYFNRSIEHSHHMSTLLKYKLNLNENGKWSNNTYLKYIKVNVKSSTK